jgi:hypothetical protein
MISAKHHNPSVRRPDCVQSSEGGNTAELLQIRMMKAVRNSSEPSVDAFILDPELPEWVGPGFWFP